MRIRKIQYTIYYSHILTFKDDYKKIVSPYFGMDKVRYSIEQTNTINESLKLIFATYNTLFHLRKDGITILFEGNESDFIKDISLIKEFFVIYEKITKLECYSRTVKHDLLTYAVNTSKPVTDSEYIKTNPCPEKLIEFACIYNYKLNNYDTNLVFGNYIPSDIEKYELSPFKTQQNEDLFSAKSGRMCEIRLIEVEKEPTFSKLKKMVYESNKQISLFK